MRNLYYYFIANDTGVVPSEFQPVSLQQMAFHMRDHASSLLFSSEEPLLLLCCEWYWSGSVRSHDGTDCHHCQETDRPPISCLSKDDYATLKSLCLPDSPADRSYKEITDLLKEYYQVQTSSTTASFTFRACRQIASGSLISVTDRNALKSTANLETISTVP